MAYYQMETGNWDFLIDPVWNALHSSQEWGKYPAIDLVQAIMRAYRSRDECEAASMLDIGCGAGANLTFLLVKDLRFMGLMVHGIDGSSAAIENARKRLLPTKQAGQTIELEQCFFQDISFESNSFDITVDYLSLCCIKFEEIKQVYSTIHKILKPGGRHYFRAFGTKTEGADSGVMIEEGTSQNPTVGPCKNMGVIHFYSFEDVKELFSEWSDVRIANHMQTNPDNPNDIIEEWTVWATK